MPVILAVGWADYLTGPDIGFSLFYLLPIAVAAWYAGRWFGVAAALTAATCWQLADLGWTESLAISMWNGLTRLAIYVVTAWLIARVRADREQLRNLNATLENALEREGALARIDPTTRLANSRAFLEHLRSDLAKFAQAHCDATLLFLDLDDFKSVNDQYGHGAGDEALSRIAAGLRRHLRGADMAARVGGDEFVVLLWHPDDEDTARQQAAIEATVAEVARDYPLAELGVSIGIARISDTLRDPEDLIRAADRAMYEVKSRRKSRRTSG